MAQDQVCARSSTSSLIQGTGTGTSLMSGHAERRPILEMLQSMDRSKGGRLSANQAARTWIWSDLHLDHADVVWCFDRPFRSVEGMRRALFEAWRQTVDETDVIICLVGDVTVGPANPPIDEALAALPGETILVAGNHDVAGGGKDYGFEAAYGVCAGFDAQGRDIGQLRERMAHLEGSPRADVRTRPRRPDWRREQANDAVLLADRRQAS